LALYLAGSWAVLWVVGYVTHFAGLPEWTSSMAFVLLLIGLPIMLATAFIQKGIPGLTDDPNDRIDPNELPGLTPEDVHRDPAAHPLARVGLFTWRNAIVGGVGAGALLVSSVSAYLLMWAFGIGPVGSMVAQGLLDPGDPALLAEFENRTSEATLGELVTGAMRLALMDSRIITLVDADRVDDVRQRLGRSGTEPLTAEVAREVARQDGIKVVVEGDVSRVGSQYVLTARIVLASEGLTIASYHESATSDEDILPAIGRLSDHVREKAGESLRDIRATRTSGP
jgi:hypothetical protein